MSYEHPADFLADFLVFADQSLPELAAVMKAWPNTPKPIRKAIAAMISTIDDSSPTT
jgi:hypothetical protein